MIELFAKRVERLFIGEKEVNLIWFNNEFVFCKPTEDLIYEQITTPLYTNAVVGGEKTNYWRISIPSKTKVIRDGVELTIVPTAIKGFSYDETLASVVMSQKITHILDGAFNGCSNLSQIYFSKNITDIGEYAFKGCPLSMSLHFPKIRNIDEYAFEDCEFLTNVKLNSYDNVNIGRYAFRNSGLISIELPYYLNDIGNNAFEYCYKLIEIYNPTELNITAGSTDYGKIAQYAKNVYTPTSGESKLSKDKDGFIFYNDNGNYLLMGKENLHISNTSHLVEFVLPTLESNKPYEIYNYAFSDWDGASKTIIPNSVTKIGDRAFQNNKSLKTITMPNSVTSIGDYAFFGSGLNTVNYAGTRNDWNKIAIDLSKNTELANATINFEVIEY